MHCQVIQGHLCGLATFKPTQVYTIVIVHTRISFAGRGVIEVPLNDVASFIKDLETSFIGRSSSWSAIIIIILHSTQCCYVIMHSIRMSGVERMIADSEECTDFIGTVLIFFIR